MNKACVLPINDHPFIKTYPYYSIYLGALEANGCDTKGIYFNHFNELMYSLHHKELDFKNRLYLQSKMNIKKFKALPSDTAIPFIKEKLNEGFYVCIMLNGKNIAGYEYEFYHDWMIYGYNDENSLFYVIGYTMFDKLNKYETFQIHYSDLLASLPKKKDLRFLRNNFMYNHLFKVSQNQALEDVNVREIYIKMKSKLKKEESFLFKKFSVYNKLIFQLKLFQKYPILIKFEKSRCPIDKRNFRVLYDYTRVNYKMFQAFCIGDKLLAEYGECVKIAARIFNLSVMYELEKDKQKQDDKYNKIVNILEFFRTSETEALKKILLNFQIMGNCTE